MMLAVWLNERRYLMPWGYDYSDFTDAELLEKENQIKADHFRMV